MHTYIHCTCTTTWPLQAVSIQNTATPSLWYLHQFKDVRTYVCTLWYYTIRKANTVLNPYNRVFTASLEHLPGAMQQTYAWLHKFLLITGMCILYRQHEGFYTTSHFSIHNVLPNGGDISSFYTLTNREYLRMSTHNPYMHVDTQTKSDTSQYIIVNVSRTCVYRYTTLLINWQEMVSFQVHNSVPIGEMS